jgi:hypothetical protein
MNNKHILFVFTILLTLVEPAAAQQPEMADVMRSEGKIYVVVGIILIILAGLIIYLFVQDKKLSKIEKLMADRKQPNNAK